MAMSAFKFVAIQLAAEATLGTSHRYPELISANPRLSGAKSCAQPITTAHDVRICKRNNAVILPYMAQGGRWL